MSQVALIVVSFLLNILGTRGTDLVAHLSNEKSTPLSYIYEDTEIRNLAHQVQHLKDATENMRLQISLITTSFEKEMALLKTHITQENKELLAKEQDTDPMKHTDECSFFNPHQKQLPTSLVQEFAKLKSEIVEEIRETFVERHYNLSDHLSHVTHSIEQNIPSTVSSNVKSEIDGVKNMLQPQINTLWTNLINDLKNSLSTNVTKEVNKLQKHSISQATNVKDEIDNLKNSLSNDVENEINKIRPQLNELSTSLKNEIEDLKNTLSVNESIKIDNLKSEIVDMKTAFQSQINSLSTNMVSKIGDSENSLSVSVKNEINSKIEQLRETIQPELDSITNASHSLEGKFDKLENSHLQMIYHDVPQQYGSCVEALQNIGQSGIYKFHLPSSGLEPFDVYCMKDPDNGPAWTVVQRREDGSTDFYRNWKEYKNGFGDLNKEFFIGLDHLHALTNQAKPQELWIELGDFEGNTKNAKYSVFEIGNEASKYNMAKLGTYSGDAGDALNIHIGHKFSTHDSNNQKSASINCAEKYKGAWWFKSCMFSHLNGEYLHGELPENYNFMSKGIHWFHWLGFHYSLKYAHMAIRPSN